MSVVTKAASKAKFQTSDIPTENDFIDLHDSVVWNDRTLQIYPDAAVDLSADRIFYLENHYVNALQALGSELKGETVACSFSNASASSGNAYTHVDAQLIVSAMWLPKPQTLTGIKFWQITQGVFTGDQTNSIALYTYSAGTITKVAESANNANIWKGASGSMQSVPFASTYVATAGIYFAGLLYNNSAQTTAPILATGTAMPQAAMNAADLTNSAKLSSTLSARTTQPTSQAMSGLSSANARIWLGFY